MKGWTDPPPGDAPLRFVVERTLGRLARWLRLLGHEAPIHDKVPSQAPAGMVVLTRRQALAGRPGVVMIASDHLPGQLAQLRDELGFIPHPELMHTRCLDCDQPVEPLSRERAMGLVPEHVLHTSPRFTRCPGCGRVFWPGSHGERARELLRQVWGEAWEGQGG